MKRVKRNLLYAAALIGWSYLSAGAALETPFSQIQTTASSGLSDHDVPGADIDTETESTFIPPTIKRICVAGNKYVPLAALAQCIPYHVGDTFSPELTRVLIKSLYALGYFKQITVKKSLNDTNELTLYVIVEEKKRLKQVKFKGNKKFTDTEIKKKVPMADLKSIDLQELQKIAILIKKLYVSKNYHFATVTPELQEDGDTAIATFVIDEKKPIFIQKVRFTGNHTFNEKKLRSLLFSREVWPFWFLDRSGSYQPEAIEMDKQTLENFYQNNGYFNAKVADVDINIDRKANIIDLTFHIDEGDVFTIGTVKAPGNEIISEEDLTPRLPVKPGQKYSREAIKTTIEALRMLWGEHGYINADVEPAIQPRKDKNSIDITFYSDLGEKVRLNRVTVRGNNKTRDKVIRRQLIVHEGQILTTRAMELSKERVESLGFFNARDGVSWKINRRPNSEVDLELHVKEINTGRVEARLGYGGSGFDVSNPASGTSINGAISDRNFLGKGIAFHLDGSIAKDSKTFNFGITQPWFYDQPISVGIEANVKRTTYDELAKTAKGEVTEHLYGGVLNAAFIAPRLNGATVGLQVGFNGLSYYQGDDTKKSTPTARVSDNGTAQSEYQKYLNRVFDRGSFMWLQWSAGQDRRSHPMHPSHGYRWSVMAKASLPSFTGNIGFYKFDADASWYTPLIGQHTLVLGLRGHFGVASNYGDYTIPYRELYHIGGPASVRGFNFGQIGPTFLSADSLGSKKAGYVTAELIFPVTDSMSIKGSVFYDGGAAWDTPATHHISSEFIKNNSFDYRQTVGFGLRVLQPQPMKIDWAFKIDRRKGESATEVHFSTWREF